MTIKTKMSECGREPFTIDWSEFFTRHGLTVGTDTITASAWVVTGGTKLSDSIIGADTPVFIEAVSAGQTVFAKNTIEINGGAYRDCRTLAIEVF